VRQLRAGTKTLYGCRAQGSKVGDNEWAVKLGDCDGALEFDYSKQACPLVMRRGLSHACPTQRWCDAILSVQ
jgi:hypothetical protein